jgi:ribosome-associated translation inhibitor RaiA
MNVTQKLALMKVNLNSVIDHDDASEKEVQAAVDELKKHIDSQWAAAKKRRAETAKAKALPR